MNIVLGFGSTEQNFEDAEREAIGSHIAERLAELGLDYFTASFIDEIKQWIGKRGKDSQALAKRYDKADEYPDRYSSYWPYVVADCNYIVVILSIHHINRRHAMSPDGWALLQTKPVFSFYAQDIWEAAKAIEARQGGNGEAGAVEDESAVPARNSP